MASTLSLSQFEQIDGLHDQLVRMGDFMECADPRAWISLSNRLGAALIDALGYEHVSQFESDEACAADLICRALSSSTLVLDEAA